MPRPRRSPVWSLGAGRETIGRVTLRPGAVNPIATGETVSVLKPDDPFWEALRQDTSGELTRKMQALQQAGMVLPEIADILCPLDLRPNPNPPPPPHTAEDTLYETLLDAAKQLKTASLNRENMCRTLGWSSYRWKNDLRPYPGIWERVKRAVKRPG